MSNWSINIGYANESMLGLKEATSDFVPRGADLTNYFKVGEYVLFLVLVG